MMSGLRVSGIILMTILGEVGLTQMLFTIFPEDPYVNVTGRHRALALHNERSGKGCVMHDVQLTFSSVWRWCAQFRYDTLTRMEKLTRNKRGTPFERC